jgi:hypothetical protein
MATFGNLWQCRGVDCQRLPKIAITLLGIVFIIRKKAQICLEWLNEGLYNFGSCCLILKNTIKWAAKLKI